MVISKSGLKKSIIDQQKDLLELPQRVKLIPRDCFNNFKKHLKSSQIKVITGIRRCGKSVLSYQLLKDKKFAYINFDDEALAGLTAKDLNDVLEIFYEIYGKFKYIFLDEAQNIQGWELFANRLQRKGFNLIITGSNARLLSRELATHLTGRNIALNLMPFSFSEFLKYRNIELKIDQLSTRQSALLKNKLGEYIKIGGFPEVVQNRLLQRTYLQSLYSDIINKDIIIKHGIKQGGALKEIVGYLISNTSSLVSFNKIKNIFNLKSAHTALNYLSFLEESFLFFLLPRFSYKSKERAVAARKLYAIDTGIIKVLGVNFSSNIGKLCENLVFLELRRRNQMNFSELFYWQNSQKNEVDFVVKQGIKIKQLIQVCYDLDNYDTKTRETRSLIQAGKELKCRNLLIITKDEEGEIDAEWTGLKRKIKIAPLWKWLISGRKI